MSEQVERNPNGDGPPDTSRRLSAQEILSATELEEREVSIPELGGSVLIREFDKGRQQWLRKQAKDGRTGKLDEHKLELLMFAYGVIEPTFTMEQVENLRRVKAGVLDRVLSEISDLSGMTDEAVEDAADMFPPES